MTFPQGNPEQAAVSPHQLDFSNASVLVTGGSDGIGYGIARAFCSAGAHVMITGTRHADSYGRDYSGMQFFQMDCTRPDSVEELSGAVCKLDALVNCIGTVSFGGAEFSRDEFETVLAVNLTGVFHLCAVFRDRLAVTGGCVINLDSVVARVPAKNNPAYSASKAGLVQLTKALAVKWGRLGIRVNGIAPGLVPTKLTSKQLEGAYEERFNRIVPLQRVGTVEDIAGVALFLASPLAAYMTGQSILVDGGISLVSPF